MLQMQVFFNPAVVALHDMHKDSRDSNETMYQFSCFEGVP